eukprot:837076_1
MDGLDCKLNLDSKFNMRGKDTSYREYYYKKKDSRTSATVRLLEKQEDALIIHHNYYGRGKNRKLKDTIHFLPQLLYIIVPVEQHNDETKKKLRQISHPRVNTIISKSMEINKILTNTAKTCVFTTENKPIKVKAYYIDAPTICFRSRGGVRRENATTF